MESITTGNLMRWHRYAGLLVAPLIIFFAVSGIWQVFRLQQSRKDGSYRAPRVLELASDFHKVEDMGRRPSASPFKWTIAAAGALLAATTALGVFVAFRVTRPRWIAVALLGVGTAVPLLLYALARLGASP